MIFWMDKPISADLPLQLETIPPMERALGEIARWWGDRFVARGSELQGQSFFS